MGPTSIRLFRGEHLDLDPPVLALVERVDRAVPAHAIDIETISIKICIFLQTELP